MTCAHTQQDSAAPPVIWPPIPDYLTRAERALLERFRLAPDAWTIIPDDQQAPNEESPGTHQVIDDAHTLAGYGLLDREKRGGKQCWRAVRGEVSAAAAALPVPDDLTDPERAVLRALRIDLRGYCSHSDTWVAEKSGWSLSVVSDALPRLLSRGLAKRCGSTFGYPETWRAATAAEIASAKPTPVATAWPPPPEGMSQEQREILRDLRTAYPAGVTYDTGSGSETDAIALSALGLAEQREDFPRGRVWFACLTERKRPPIVYETNVTAPRTGLARPCRFEARDISREVGAQGGLTAYVVTFAVDGEIVVDGTWDGKAFSGLMTTRATNRGATMIAAAELPAVTGLTRANIEEIERLLRGAEPVGFEDAGPLPPNLPAFDRVAAYHKANMDAAMQALRAACEIAAESFRQCVAAVERAASEIGLRAIEQAIDEAAPLPKPWSRLFDAVRELERSKVDAQAEIEAAALRHGNDALEVALLRHRHRCAQIERERVVCDLASAALGEARRAVGMSQDAIDALAESALRRNAAIR